MAKKEEAIQSLQLEHQKSMSKNEENVKLVHNLEETVSGLQRENKMANGKVCKSLCKTWYFFYMKNIYNFVRWHSERLLSAANILYSKAKYTISKMLYIKV